MCAVGLLMQSVGTMTRTVPPTTRSDHHGILLSFGTTIDHAFPLILIIGREPNTDLRIVNDLGKYDFREAPHCGFWNTSYGTIARIGAGSTLPAVSAAQAANQTEAHPPHSADAQRLKNKTLTTRQLKQLCVLKQSSPIIYADALPIGLKYHVVGKHDYRSQIAPETIHQHIANIFAHTILIDRVRLVLTSGLQDQAFERAKHWIEHICQERHTAIMHLPFFYGNNTPKILTALDDGCRHVIKEIVDKFRRAT